VFWGLNRITERQNAHGQQHITRAYRPCVCTVYIIVLVKKVGFKPGVEE